MKPGEEKTSHEFMKNWCHSGNRKLSFYSSTNENHSNKYCNQIYENKCSQAVHVLEYLDTSYSVH